jgi:hypothetical protein
MEKEYNGWNNYQTFRVSHDILGNVFFDEMVTEKILRKIVTDYLFSGNPTNTLVTDYANLFLEKVDWDELVEVYNTDILADKLNLQPKHKD